MLMQSELNSPNTVTGAGYTGKSFLELNNQLSMALVSEVQKMEKDLDTSPHNTEIPPPPRSISIKTLSAPNSPPRPD